MKQPTTYRLPNGKYTTSAKFYTTQWRKISKRLEKEFGFVTIGCDPGFLLRKKDNWNSSFQLPLWAVEIILKRLDTHLEDACNTCENLEG